MALNKSIITNMGFPVEYWKILSYAGNTSMHTFVIQLSPYYNQQVRMDGKGPIVSETRTINVINGAPSEDDHYYDDYFSAPVMANSQENVLQRAYRYIKEKVPEFINAVDC